ncbi:MAG: hypothetical protein K2H18_04705, partial [Muribaculaceae bacterium]|nr:hypothetical protein [Muribaculaceae bacterium]
IQAKNPGIAKLIVYNKRDNTVREEITVSVGESDPFTKLEFEQAQLAVTLNEEPLRLGMIYSPEDAQFDHLIWSSSNPEVAVVDVEGAITTVAVGETVITARTADGSNLLAHCKLNVVEGSEVKEFGINIGSIEVEPGEVFTLEPILPYETMRIKWRVEEEQSTVEMLSFSNDRGGRFLALAEGTARIELTSPDDSSKKAYCDVSVGPLTLKGIKIERNFEEIDIREGKQQVRAVLEPYFYDPNIRWVSSDESVATVEAKDAGYAHVTPLRAGMTTISVEHLDHPEISDSYMLSVTDIPTGIDDIIDEEDERVVDLYTVTGLVLRKQIRVSEIKSLTPDVYIMVDERGARKIRVHND